MKDLSDWSISVMGWARTRMTRDWKVKVKGMIRWRIGRRCCQPHRRSIHLKGNKTIFLLINAAINPPWTSRFLFHFIFFYLCYTAQVVCLGTMQWIKNNLDNITITCNWYLWYYGCFILLSLFLWALNQKTKLLCVQQAKLTKICNQRLDIERHELCNQRCKACCD